MSAYTSQAAIQGYVSLADLIGLTDDQGVGNVDSTVLNQVIANVSAEIDSAVASIYDVPFANPPEAITGPATVMACYALYRRRLVPDEKNMFYEEAKAFREHFRKIGKGEEELDANTSRAFNPGYVETTGSQLSYPMSG